MAFNPAPTELWPSYLFDVGSDDTLHIPRAAIPGLEAADCDASTGDLRKILTAIHNQEWNWYNALASADSPSALTIKQPQQGLGHGTWAGYVKVTYDVEMYSAFGTPTIADEPA